MIGDCTSINLNSELEARSMRDIPNKETIDALNEFSRMKSDKFEYKRYNSFSDIMKEEKCPPSNHSNLY